MIIKDIDKEILERLHDALRKMGKDELYPQYKESWTEKRPTTGYCSVAVEVFMRYFAPEGSKTYYVDTGDNETHWFIRDPNGDVIDPTKD